nr:unnamed protein product [Spirometra erinaceieuropaei]
MEEEEEEEEKGFQSDQHTHPSAIGDSMNRINFLTIVCMLLLCLITAEGHPAALQRALRQAKTSGHPYVCFTESEFSEVLKQGSSDQQLRKRAPELIFEVE